MGNLLFRWVACAAVPERYDDGDGEDALPRLRLRWPGQEEPVRYLKRTIACSFPVACDLTSHVAHLRALFFFCPSLPAHCKKSAIPQTADP